MKRVVVAVAFALAGLIAMINHKRTHKKERG